MEENCEDPHQLSMEDKHSGNAEDQEEEVPDIDPTDFKRQEYNQSGEPVKMKRIERSDMLKICGTFNKHLQEAKDGTVSSKKGPLSILLTSGTGASQKSKTSLIEMHY